MSYNKFSDWYKKVLVNAENSIKQIWLNELNIEDVFLEIIKNTNWWLKEVFTLYWINEKLTLEIINKWVFNETFEKRKWVYSWMSLRLKNIILWSVKIAASYSKEKPSLEDFLLSIIRNDSWFNNFLDYVGITPSDIESNIIDLNKLWIIDWLKNWQTNSNNININDNLDKILWSLSQNLFWDLNDDNITTPFDQNKKTENDNKKDSTTPALDFFSNDLTKECHEWKIEHIIWRDQEIERLIAILNRKTKNNPVLVWEPWVGKTAIAEWLALRIVKWNVPFSMKDKRVLSLDMSSLIAGTKYRWEFESRIKQVIEEASKVENEVVLFIDEIHTIIWAWWWEWTLDASNILKPAMWRWKIRVIWATTSNEYQKYIEKDSALERRFQKIVIEEPEKDVSIEIISWLKESFENYHNLNITDEAVFWAVELSNRYITEKYLPDKAIDLIDEACSIKSMKYNFDESETKSIREKIVKMQKDIENAVISQSYKKAYKLKEDQAKLELKIVELKKKFNIPKEKRLNVTIEDVQKVLNMSTGIPIANLNKQEIDKLKNLPNDIRKEIIGQDNAVENIVKSIIRSKAWIWNEYRPTWSFLFLWPTWVWKTELVKVLARKFYDDKKALIKIDMSEYSEKTSVNKLIWASAWYVWYEEGWLLTEKVRKKPYSVILFDEIEKWGFEVYNLLLQILEEWVLTDNKWRLVNFKNTIIVMTSNIWQEEFIEKANKIGFDLSDLEEDKIMIDYERASKNIKDNLTDYFSPEFINRIDKIIVFNPLDKNMIKKIVKLQLNSLEDKLKSKNISLTYNYKVLNHITKTVYNPEFWAREVRRFITDYIEDIMAEKIIMIPNKKSFEIIVEKWELVIK